MELKDIFVGMVNLGGVGLFAVAMFHLHREFIKTHREDLAASQKQYREDIAAERKQCHDDHQLILESVRLILRRLRGRRRKPKTPDKGSTHA